MPPANGKRWLWLIPGIPAGILLLLLLPIALIAGGNVAGSFFGPVNVWNRTTQIPPDADVAGVYRYSEGGSVNDPDFHVMVPDNSSFTLKPNHELVVHNLPKLDGFGKPTGCAYNGTGKWGIGGNGEGFSLNFDVTSALPANPGDLPSCTPEHFGAFDILGKSRPYRFWYVIGDPDTGEGILYKLR
jgi:hypothetical protein